MVHLCASDSVNDRMSSGWSDGRTTVLGGVQTRFCTLSCEQEELAGVFEPGDPADRTKKDASKRDSPEIALCTHFFL